MDITKNSLEADSRAQHKVLQIHQIKECLGFRICVQRELNL